MKSFGPYKLATKALRRKVKEMNISCKFVIKVLSLLHNEKQRKI
jgi:hypothetical protein